MRFGGGGVWWWWLNKEELQILIKLVNVKSNLVPFPIFPFMAKKHSMRRVVSPLMSERCSQIAQILVIIFRH